MPIPQQAPVEQQVLYFASPSSSPETNQRQNSSNTPIDAHMSKQCYRGKQVKSSPEFNLTNFPMLSAVTVKNPFEVLPCGTGDIQQLPIDRGRGHLTC